MTDRIPRPPRQRPVADPAAAVERAREALAVAQAITSTHPLMATVRRLAGHLDGLLTIADEHYLLPPAPPAERQAAREALLAEVPASQRAQGAPDNDEAATVATLLAQLGDDTAAIVTGWLRAVRDEAADDSDGTEPYCTTCSGWVGMFVGLDGWRHFRGDPAPGGQRELYDAGHEPVIGWTRPCVLAPGEAATVLAALDEAAEYKLDKADTCGECDAQPDGGLCQTCEWRMERVGEYRALAARLTGGNHASA